MTANVNDRIAEAIDILIKKRLNTAGLDQTIVGKIVDIINSASGIYKIEYQSIVFEAYSEENNKNYQIGDNVFIKVPNGDFTNKKIIEGKTIGVSAAINESEKLKNFLIPSYPSFSFLTSEEERGELVAGQDNNIYIDQEIINETYQTVWEQEFSDIELLNFQLLASKHETIKLEGKFITNLINGAIEGNYGLRFNFLVDSIEDKEEQEIYTYVLDLENFVGSPYKFNTGAIQSIYINFPKGLLKNLYSIDFFQAMQQDKDINNINNPEERLIDKPNLFVEDIKITFLQSQDLSSSNYYGYIEASQGYIYKDQNLEFEPVLLYNGKNVTNETEYTVQWYKEMPISTFDNYEKNEWNLIENSDYENIQEKKLIFLGFPQEQISQQYKIIIINKNNDIVFETIFTITQEREQLPEIIQDTINHNEIKLKILPNNEYLGIWRYNNSVIKQENDNIYSSEIIILNKNINQKELNVYCQIYDLDFNYLGSQSFLLSNVEQNTDIDFIFEGSDKYQYDNNGDILLEEAQKDKQLKTKIEIKSGKVLNIKSIEFFVGDYLIPKQKVNNEEKDKMLNSMLENIWIDDNNIIHYTIKSKYDLKNKNNIITAKIILISGQEFVFQKEIQFLKSGDSSFSGNSFSCIFKPNNDNYFYYFNNDIKDNSINYTLQLDIYDNGKLITPDDISKYQIEINKLKLNNQEIDLPELAVYDANKEYYPGDIVKQNIYDQNNDKYLSYYYECQQETVPQSNIKLIIRDLDFAISVNKNEETSDDAKTQDFFQTNTYLMEMEEKNILTMEEFIGLGEYINSAHKEFIENIENQIILDFENNSIAQTTEYWKAIDLFDSNLENLLKLLLGEWIINKENIKDTGDNVVFAQININNNIIPVYFGIPLAYQKQQQQILTNEKIKTNINFSTFVKYNSSGSNPSYYQQEENNQEKEQEKIITIELEDNNMLELYNPYNFKPSKNYNYSKGGEDKYYIGALIEHEIENSIIIRQPVIYYLNSYGNENINNWEGNLIPTENNDTFLASSIIAGTKDKNGKLTGVGIGKVASEGQEGLYGYSQGINTFGLKADGTAYFGVGKAIQINGTEAKIEGNGGTGKMILDLMANSNSEKAIDIQYNNKSTFYVDYKGQAYLSGEINAIKGKIGNWTIDDGGIKAGNTLLSSKGVINTQYLTINDSEGNLIGQLGQQESGHFGLTAISKKPIYLQSTEGIYINNQSLQDFIKGVINDNIN